MVRKELTKDTLDELRTIAIYGDTGGRKTSLAYNVINKLKIEITKRKK